MAELEGAQVRLHMRACTGKPPRCGAVSGIDIMVWQMHEDRGKNCARPLVLSDDYSTTTQYLGIGAILNQACCMMHPE